MVLITGGERSGKSSFALQLAMRLGKSRAFIATAEPIDEEMQNRIEVHKRERAGLFDTFEEPVNVTAILRETASYDVCVFECVTTWLANIMYRKMDVRQAVADFLSSLNGNEIVVTNEVGMGVVPADADTRQYVEELGRLNMKLAEVADEAYFIVSGIPMRIK